MSTVLWGTDYERCHSVLVTNEDILAADYEELRSMWTELRGTGTYLESAKAYLEEKGYTLKDSYSFISNQDPATWDILATSLAVDSDVLVNTYDGLMEYDMENELQPALAESYTVSDDGLTYTFKLREGVKWVDSQGREVADVTADDFVAGMQHVLDAQGGLEYLVDGLILNATGYLNGEITDFSEVGVKAVDDYTVEYTLEEPCSYFMTMLGYSIFAPMSRSYYTSQGGKFGMEFDSSAADYTYGKGPESIAYCGPYLVSSFTAKNSILFTENPTYWNPDNVNVSTLTFVYDDGSDETKRYTDFNNSTTDYVTLSQAIVELAKTDGVFDDYAIISNTDATTYLNTYNLNREAFANFNDGTTAVSTQTEEDAARTKAAMNNVHFRRAISFALDRGAFNAQVTGEDLKLTSLRNSYTPWNFVSLEEDTTVDINGTETTFEAGTYYGEIMQAQIDADGVPIKAYDPEADNGNGSGDGYDGWYSVENAVAELETAISELAEEGVTIDADNPIYLDLVYPANFESYSNRASAYKQSVEASLNGLVVINTVSSPDIDGWYYATYYPSYGYEMNCDINDGTGWSPDYGDPSTYLDTLLPDYQGYATKCMGIY